MNYIIGIIIRSSKYDVQDRGVQGRHHGDALLEILTERIRNGNLQTVLEINLGYYIPDQNLVNQTSGTVWQLIPVWQIRGYNRILDQRLEGVLSTYSEED